MEYRYQIQDYDISFEEALGILKERINNEILTGSVNIDNAKRKIIDNLKEIGIKTVFIKIENGLYNDFISKVNYNEKYPEYYKDNLPEKSFEHFICAKFIFSEPTFTDKLAGPVVDIGSEHSPLGEIFHDIYSTEYYMQDIMYSDGIHGNKIGSDAGNIPVSDNFFTAASVSCSIEHFEKDSDIKFMREMARVLKPGGSVIIVPLYLYNIPACQTDPVYAIKGNVSFDEDAVIYCAERWGNRHGRFYSPETLHKRLITPNPSMEFTVYVVENAKDIHESIYCRFLLVARKK